MPYVERCVECSGTGEARPPVGGSRYLPYHAWGLVSEDAPTDARCTTCRGEGLVGGARMRPLPTRADDVVRDRLLAYRPPVPRPTSAAALRHARSLLAPDEVRRLLDDLTPEEREQLKKDQAEEWERTVAAFRELVPVFREVGKRIGDAFLRWAERVNAIGAPKATHAPPPVPLVRRGSRKDRRNANPSDPREVLFDRSSHRYRGRA